MTTSVPFVDLKTQYRRLKPQMDAAIQSVMERSAFIMGKEHNEFEQAFASYISTRHCIGGCDWYACIGIGSTSVRHRSGR